MSQMERTWPDKEKNMKLLFSHFLHFFSIYPFCQNMWIWIADSINQSPLSEKTANRTYPRSEFWKFHPKIAHSDEIPKIQLWLSENFSENCTQNFQSSKILRHRFRAKKCYFRIAKSRIFGYLEHLKHFFLFGVKSENTVWLIIPIS